jgi:histidinol dehydrogenase
MKNLDWNTLGTAERDALLSRPASQDTPDKRAEVQRLIAQVRADGDSSLRALTRRFDGAELAALEVCAEEFHEAESALSAELKTVIGRAIKRIESFHRATQPAPVAIQTATGVHCERLVVPIDRVGLYVPAGSAPLPSTAMMLAVPARLAGVPEIVLCSPPRADGSVDPAVLYVAQQTQVNRVYKLGGVQAIAGMAYGSESVPRCDKIFGPGNSWVTLAKRLVSEAADGVAIDMPAGPSEVLVIADGRANAEFVAADLLAQAEHGPDSQVMLFSDSKALIEHTLSAVELQLAELPRAHIARAALAHSAAVLFEDLSEAVAVSNRYAPEHLILNVAQPRALLTKVRNAGSVFLGAYTPESVGDYCSGTNHVLPTGGWARNLSGVSVQSFVKLITVQSLSFDGLRQIGPDTMVLAEAEGLHGHALAVRRRLEAA